MFKFQHLFQNADEKTAIGNNFRNRRFQFFLDKIAHLPKPIQILDVGGMPKFWEQRGMQNNPDIHVTLLNLEAQPVAFSNFKSVAGDATNMHFIADKQFDLVFSNSVIEHLYTKENQLKMSREVKRVGKYYFVQTPNRYFPVEAHYMLPYMQFIPKTVRYFILTKTKLSLLKKWDPAFARQCINEIRLLNLKEMKGLFPEGKIFLEKYAGLTKSITAYNI
jgi:predicted SAM-dependent methyltransferase